MNQPLSSFAFNSNVRRYTEVTINQYAVKAMFLISGLGLPLLELQKAVKNVKANALIQTFIFVVAGFAVAVFFGPVGQCSLTF